MSKAVTKRTRNNSPMALLPIIVGIALNFLFAKLAAALGLPIYLDCIGTVVASALGGYLPGILTAIINNLINYSLDSISIYYAGISALIAIATVQCEHRGWFKKISGVIRFILILAFIGGVLGGTITWFLSGVATEGTSYTLLIKFREWLGMNRASNLFIPHILSSFVLDLIDKTITALITILIVRLVPSKYEHALWFSAWRQTPIIEEEDKVEQSMTGGLHSLNTKIIIVLVFATLAMAMVVTGVASTLFTNYSKQQHTRTVVGAAKMAAKAIDPNRVDEFLEKGESAEGYIKAETELRSIRDNMPDIEYVYVYKIQEDGCHVVFDLDTQELKGEEPGTLIPFDESFEKYIPTLLKGERIDPIETDDTYGWLLTAYEPIYNEKNECVAYAAADEMVVGIKEYEREYAIKVVLLFIGFFILILVIGLWVAKYNLILPINSMATMADNFAESEETHDEVQMSKNYESIKGLDIRTGDEVQKLYESFCKMTGDTVEHVRDIQEQSKEIQDLQNGLIITMADMVEGRDSDTGNHVRKTAAYARIILEALKRKGYFSDQITDEYIDDVERSAPLHDIGKIAVSDMILNKPGKLTDDEFEIMKTHTTAGKELIDQAIQTVHGEGYLTQGRDLAAYHHEKWNGKGYPEGLAGEEIPLSARVMAIADVFDALSSKRIYKDAMPFEKAVSIIKEDAGTHFDPQCVEAFLDSLDEVKKVLDYYNELESEGERVKGKEVKKDE